MNSVVRGTPVFPRPVFWPINPGVSFDHLVLGFPVPKHGRAFFFKRYGQVLQFFARRKSKTIFGFGSSLNRALRAAALFINKEHLSIVFEVHDFYGVHVNPTLCCVINSRINTRLILWDGQCPLVQAASLGASHLP